jgi:hypothetical protein
MKNSTSISVIICLFIFTYLFPLVEHIVERINSYEQKIPAGLLYLCGYIMFPVGNFATSLFVLKEKTKELLVSYALTFSFSVLGFIVSVLYPHPISKVWGLFLSVFPGFFMVYKVIQFKKPFQPLREIAIIISSLILSPVFFMIPLGLFSFTFSVNNPDDLGIAVKYFLFFLAVAGFSLVVRKIRFL